MFVEFIIFLLTFIFAYYVYVHKKIHRHFDKYGIKYVPGVPVFGNTLWSTLMKRHMNDEIDAVYKAFPDERYVGYVEGTTPIIMVRDPEIIKNITVKDFDHFVNHKQFFIETEGDLFTGSLLLMKDDRWREMRTTLSPAFTGSKMRHMMPFMTEISDNIVEYLKDHLNENIDIDDLIRRYTNDVIASTGFGLKVNSLKDKDNEFYLAGQNIFKFTFFQRVYFFFSFQFPVIAKIFKVKFLSDKTTKFFENIVSSTIEYRTKNNVERPDMIQLLMAASKGNLHCDTDTKDTEDLGFAINKETLTPRESVPKWTITDLTAQVFIFFAAGFESSASTLVMCIHELALNPNVQEKLYEEVKDYKERKGCLTFDGIADLKYLDCVLNETQRKWSAAIVIDRVCTKAYELPPVREGEKPYIIKPGDLIYNAVNSLQMDSKYFPEPEKFDPERFSEENRHDIKPFTFLPFGIGPRICIGSRFALLELKVMLYKLVLNYKIVKSEKTLDPMRLVTVDFNIKVPGNTWVKLEARN